MTVELEDEQNDLGHGGIDIVIGCAVNHGIVACKYHSGKSAITQVLARRQ